MLQRVLDSLGYRRSQAIVQGLIRRRCLRPFLTVHVLIPVRNACIRPEILISTLIPLVIVVTIAVIPCLLVTAVRRPSSTLFLGTSCCNMPKLLAIVAFYWSSGRGRGRGRWLRLLRPLRLL